MNKSRDMTPDEIYEETGICLVITTVDGGSFLVSSLASLKNPSGWCYAQENTPIFEDDLPPSLVKIDNISSITVIKQDGHPQHLSREEEDLLRQALLLFANEGAER